MELRPDLRKGLACHTAKGTAKKSITRKTGLPHCNTSCWESSAGNVLAMQTRALGRPASVTRVKGLCEAGQ